MYVQKRRVRLSILSLALLFTVLMGACDRDTEAPTTPEIIQSYASATDSMSLSWLPATDDTTKVTDLQYEVHVSETTGFTPSAETRKTTVTGKTEADVSGLNRETRYYIQVLALDAAGNSSPKSNTSTSITTLTLEHILRPGVTLHTADELNLGEPEIQDNLFIYTKAAGTLTPALDSIITGPAGNSGYLRRVLSVSEAEGKILIETADASLSDLYSQSQIQDKTRFYDIPAAAQKLPESRRLEELLPDGTRRIALFYDNGSLMAEQIEVVPAEESSALSRTLSVVGLAGPSFEDGVDMNLDVSFDPELSKSLSFTDDFPNIEEAHLIVSGTFSATGTLTYEATAEAPILERKKTILKKTYYPHTRIPHKGIALLLYTKVTLTVDLIFGGRSYAALKAEANVNVSADMEYGIRYNPATAEWDPIARNPDPQTSLTTQLHIRGGIEAYGKIVPTIEIEYLGVLSYKNWYEANIQNELEVEALFDQDILENVASDLFQISKYNYTFQQVCKHQATFDIFFLPAKDILEESDYCSPDDITLFNLPTMTVTAENGEETFTLTLETEDGANNAFDSSSVQWYVFPEEGTLTQDASNPLQATFTPTDPDKTYFFYVSGHGVLGEIGRRWAKTQGKLTETDHGFIVSPSRTPADGISGNRLLIPSGSSYTVTQVSGQSFGNIDWKGQFVGGQASKVLSYQGPATRYFGEANFGSAIFQNGKHFASAPGRVLGAAISKDGAGAEWILAVVNSGAEDIVFRRPNSLNTSAALYDADSAPDGWRELGRFPMVSGESISGGWFFNGTGTEAQAMRYRPFDVFHGDQRSTLDRLKISVSGSSASFQNLGNARGMGANSVIAVDFNAGGVALLGISGADWLNVDGARIVAREHMNVVCYSSNDPWYNSGVTCGDPTVGTFLATFSAFKEDGIYAADYLDSDPLYDSGFIHVYYVDIRTRVAAYIVRRAGGSGFSDGTNDYFMTNGAQKIAAPPVISDGRNRNIRDFYLSDTNYSDSSGLGYYTKENNFFAAGFPWQSSAGFGVDVQGNLAASETRFDGSVFNFISFSNLGNLFGLDDSADSFHPLGIR